MSARLTGSALKNSISIRSGFPLIWKNCGFIGLLNRIRPLPIYPICTPVHWKALLFWTTGWRFQVDDRFERGFIDLSEVAVANGKSVDLKWISRLQRALVLMGVRSLAGPSQLACDETISEIGG
jgi:hypothetical protein